MTWETLQTIVGTALVDREFAKQLLDQTPEALLRFDLTDDEYRRVASIRAASLDQFAMQLDQLLSGWDREQLLRSRLGVPMWPNQCRLIST